MMSVPDRGDHTAHEPRRDEIGANGADWRHEAAALRSPTAYWLLAQLAEAGPIELKRLEAEFGASAEDWLALGMLMRAGWVWETDTAIHLTGTGWAGLEEFRKLHPELVEEPQ